MAARSRATCRIKNSTGSLGLDVSGFWNTTPTNIVGNYGVTDSNAPYIAAGMLTAAQPLAWYQQHTGTGGAGPLAGPLFILVNHLVQRRPASSAGPSHLRNQAGWHPSLGTRVVFDEAETAAAPSARAEGRVGRKQ